MRKSCRSHILSYKYILISIFIAWILFLSNSMSVLSEERYGKNNSISPYYSYSLLMNWASYHYIFNSPLFFMLAENNVKDISEIMSYYSKNINTEQKQDNLLDLAMLQDEEAVKELVQNLEVVDIAQNLENNNSSQDSVLVEDSDFFDDYYNDLDFQDRTIFELYKRHKNKFIFMRPPALDRQSMSKEPLKDFQPSGYKKLGELDSTGTLVSTQEKFNEYELSYDYKIDLDDYLARRKENLQGKIWDSLTTDYDIKKALSRKDLAFLLGQATGLAIPLPPNPVLNIFGKPELSINVAGQVNVTIGWQINKQNLGAVSAFGQIQSSPIFRQDINVNVGARIGDKLKFSINQNTRNQWNYDNKFKIGYEGYEDDIVKKVEVGNVDFQIPSILIGSGTELFGVRADFQFGPLFLKTVFSQRKGQKRFVDVTGGASKQKFSLRAYQYADNHFFLDTAYKKVYNDYFKNSTPLIPKSGAPLRIKQIQVWEAATDITNPHVADAVAIADLDGKRRKMGEDWDVSIKQTTIKTGSVERGRFALLDSNQYIIDHNLGTLTLKTFRRDRYYAVSYRVEGATSDTLDDVYYGYFHDQVGLKDTLLLKLIYRPNLLPAYKTLWERRMRNKYNIGSSNVNLADANISLWYIQQSNDSTDLLEGAPDKLVTILGVDQVTNSTGAAPPDGQFDITVAAFFDPVRGELTFPHTEPFGDGLRDYFSKIGNPELAELYTFDQVYDTTMEVAKKNTARDRFVISGEISGRATNRISLGAFNLSPGSVKVTLDGVLLREYDDYVVDYFSGSLTIRNPRAMLPNANLKVEYEQQDIFTSSTKTMAGIRADYELFRNRYMTATLGGTFMHYKQAKISDRARLGDEPIANTMLGFDFNFQADAPWITRALDMLPFYDTKTPSSINLFGEWAMVSPTPNRVRSEITSDNNEPVAEIDNFEAAMRSTTLVTQPTQWQFSSPPIMPEILGIDSTMSEIEQGKIASDFRGRLFWYQYFIARDKITDIYPKNRTYQSGMQNVSVLHIYFEPAYRGIYNMNPKYLDRDNPKFEEPHYLYDVSIRKKTWGGMQRILSSYSTNFDDDNIEYLEIMMRVDNVELGNSKMYIDMGMISEDIISNGKGDTEDGITEKNPLPNGIIDEGEDVGIDGLNNEQEKEVYPYPLNLEDDPARDDYYFDFGKDDHKRVREDFMRYNKYENNAKYAETGQFPDKEMMNPNNGQTISLDNSYFTYEINLDTNAERNPQIVGGNPERGWYQYRIPIRKPHKRVGNPQFSNIQYVRVRFGGGPVAISVADWKLVGSYWQRMSNFQENFDPNDSTLSVSYVNVWENSGPPDYYTMPPGVSAPRQLSSYADNSYDARLNEQSLSLNVKNLRWGEERSAVKIFHDQDFFNYKRLKLFLHGDGSMPSEISAQSKPKAYAFIRFGIDSGNYYEYRKPIVQGWQEIDINLSELTAIKQVRDTMMKFDRQVFPVANDPTAHFAIKGNPILTRVQFVGLGVANPSDAFQELTTTVWVDELRLISPENSNDWAGIANFSTNLADLGTINASFSNYEPNFHQLEERYGNRSQSREWNIVLTGNLEKFAPQSFRQMKIPISYTHSEIIENPKYEAANDIELATAAATAYNHEIARGSSPEIAQKVADEVKMRSQTVKVQDSWALTGIKLGIPIRHWLVDKTLNSVTASYSYSQEFERSPLYQERFNWMWRLNLGYSLPIPDLLVVKPLSFLTEIPFIGAYRDWKLNFLPSNFSTNLDMQRRRQTEQSRFLEMPSPVIRDFSANRAMQFNWKLSQGGFISPTFDYKFSTTSTLVPYELNELGKQRTGSELSKVILLNERLINLGDPNFHDQNVTLNINPVLPNIIGLDKFFTITGNYNANYQWQDPLQTDPALKDAAKRASVNSNTRFTVGVKLQDIGNSIFGKATPFGRPSGSSRSSKAPQDANSGGSIWQDIADVFQSIFFDWERLNLTFNQTNASINPGVFGSTGFDNFWGRGITGRESQLHRGPSFAYQLGLISNPHGSFKMLKSDRFPYFGFEAKDGPRPANAVFQDNFNQNTNFDIKTSRKILENMSIDLNWKSTLGYNRNYTVDTDENGIPTYSNIMITENLNRTFITGPKLFGVHFFGNSIENVVNIFNEKRISIDNNPNMDTVTKNQALHAALAESFYEGLEAFSFTSGNIGKFLPSINWSFRWEGIEKWAIWNGLIKHMQIEHAYTSTYVENAQVTDIGRSLGTQTINSGFSPLFGVSASFDEKIFKGILKASVKWSQTTAYSATAASGAIISMQNTTDITATASYVMKGFEFPLFGISLKNDFEVSFLFTYKDNNTGTYDVLDRGSFTGENVDGRTLTGNTQIIIEPRARYNISQIITASFFIRYEGTFNEGAAQPGYHTLQIGLDIMLNISGGR
jgi:cell surface protein SprA